MDWEPPPFDWRMVRFRGRALGEWVEDEDLLRAIAQEIDEARGRVPPTVLDTSDLEDVTPPRGGRVFRRRRAADNPRYRDGRLMYRSHDPRATWRPRQREHPIEWYDADR